MTDAERQALQDEYAACMARAANIVATLAGAAIPSLSAPARNEFVSLKTAAAAWGIEDGSARKRVKCIAKSRPDLATKRGVGRWWVHLETLR
jgi:hypothetical protein